MLVGESIVTLNSQKIPCNQTHYVAALTISMYLTSANESEMVCCFLLDQEMEPSANMKTKPEFYFLSAGSLAQSESENIAS